MVAVGKGGDGHGGEGGVNRIKRTGMEGGGHRI